MGIWIFDTMDETEFKELDRSNEQDPEKFAYNVFQDDKQYTPAVFVYRKFRCLFPIFIDVNNMKNCPHPSIKLWSVIKMYFKTHYGNLLQSFMKSD